MEPERQLAPAPIACENCKQPALVPGEKFCTGCGFPQGGTDDERVAFHRQARRLIADRQERDKLVGNARIILFVVAILNVVPYLLNGKPAVIAIGVVISALFAGMGVWAKYRPFPAILTAFILFILLNVLSAIRDPASIASGILMKVITISGLLYALRSMQRVAAADRPR